MPRRRPQRLTSLGAVEPIDANTIATVTDVLDPERQLLVGLLSGLDDNDWQRDTECPGWSVQGIATHVLGNDQQAADILTLAHTEADVRSLVSGPDELLALFALRLGRRP